MPKEKPTSPSTGSNPSGSVGGSVETLPPWECPSKVEFKELGTAYGFDDHTSKTTPWKSVEKGKSDTVKAEITPADKASKASFESTKTGKVTVSPATAGSATQTVTVTGVENGESDIKATCSGSVIGKFKTKTYTKKSKTVAVRLGA